MPTRIEIENLCLRVLDRAGVPPLNAARQAALLVEAELRGHASHGLLRLPRIVERIRNKVADPRTEGSATWRQDALLHVDGRAGLGPVVAMAAIDRLCERLPQTGIAMAAITNCNHLGRLAWYVEEIARRGFASLAVTISEALVHPWGGRRAMLGTNPVAIGVPAEPEPFVLDMATSIVSMGKIHDYANRGEALEPGWALDAAGEPTLDAVAAKAGALAPFGGAKGYALGLGFEVLVGSLTVCALGTEVQGTLDSTRPCNKGDIFIVMQPASGAGAAVSAYLAAVRASAAADAARAVRVPGDAERLVRERWWDGDIPVPADIWSRLLELAGPSGEGGI